MKKRALILCVEDEADLRRDITEELIEAGYEVCEACNGETALESITRARPDLILCDISMPGKMNGFDLLNTVKRVGSDHADIPFVFLSALAEPHQVADGKRTGADDYLVKPIDYDLLLATIEARLRQLDLIRENHPASDTGDQTAIFVGAYGLTPAETRIAIALTQGLRMTQISDDFGISRTTVAFHLRNIFQKVGVSRQAELILLLVQRLQS